MQGQFSGLGAKGIAFGADYIADVKGFEGRKGLLADLVLLDVELNTSLAVLKLDKGGLAKRTAGQDASCHDKNIMNGVDLLLIAVCCNDIG